MSSKTRLLLTSLLFATNLIASPENDIVDYKIESVAPGAFKKYVIDKNNKKHEWNEYRAKKSKERNSKYGNFDAITREQIDLLPDDKIEQVEITFNHISNLTHKNMDTERQLQLELKKAGEKGLEKVRRFFEKNVAATNQMDPNTYLVNLSVREIKKLQHMDGISNISIVSLLPPPSEMVPDAITLAEINTTGRGSTSCGYNGLQTKTFWDAGYKGQNVIIGVLDGYDMPEETFNQFLTGVPVEKQNSFSLGGPNDHGVHVTAMIRNQFTGLNSGGAPSVSAIKYSYNMDPPFGLNWILDRGAKVVNCSFGTYIWKTYNAWKYARHYDIQVATRWYTHVTSAGNNGHSYTPEAYYCWNRDDPNWTAERCVQSWKLARNTIVVGALMDECQSVAPTSCKVNSEFTGDELPHVVAPGYDINITTNKYISGTSFASPAVASLAACMISKNSSLAYYPELIRAAMMASAAPSKQAYPHAGTVEALFSSDNDNVDLAAGAGVPNGTILNEMANRVYYGNVVNLSGTDPKKICALSAHSFSPYENSGSLIQTTINLTNVPAGYIHVYLTWLSNPDGTSTVGQPYSADDIDLYVSPSSNPNDWNARRSATWHNTTEAVKYYWGGGSGTLYASSYLYSRITDKVIWCGMAYSYSAQ